MVDDNQRSEKYPHIDAAGVCIAIPPVEVTLVPTGAPKAGHIIATMVTAIVKNVVTKMTGPLSTAKGSWNALCLADMGSTGLSVVAVPQIPPRNINWFKKVRWMHWAKAAFEKYVIYKMKKGTSEPLYEEYMLKSLGIH